MSGSVITRGQFDTPAVSSASVPGASVVVASNRGPASFVPDGRGGLALRQASGGLVAGLGGLADRAASSWVCAALSHADRRAAREAPGGRIGPPGEAAGPGLRMLDIDQTTFERAYNAVANRTLWFLHHLLFDTAHAPAFDERFRREWTAYERYNAAFADALAEEAALGAKVLIQDYHLSLAPGMLRQRRPDLRIGHFSHTPWAPPAYFRLLPDGIARQLLAGLLAADAVGFLSPRWAAAFRQCCAEYGEQPRQVQVHQLGVDPAGLRARAGEADVAARLAGLRGYLGDRRLILRIDRTELSKNIVRGLAAYRELLGTYPEWRGRVMHLACAYPSRHDLPEYREYTAAVQRLAREIDDEFATPDWNPLVLEVNDDYARSLAAYALADVLVVNPIRDGMNLVAKEGVVLSERDAVLVLSREAGAADELGAAALLVNPFDVSQTAAAIDAALRLPPAERASRAGALRAAATRLPPQAWLAAQLAALD